MIYHFLPEKVVSENLLSYYRTKLHSSFIHLLEDINRSKPEIVNEKISKLFNKNKQFQYTGFQCLAYHNVLDTLQNHEDDSFKAISEMVEILDSDCYYDLYTKKECTSNDILKTLLNEKEFPHDNNEISLLDESELKIAVIKMEQACEIIRSSCNDIFSEIETIIKTITFFKDNFLSDNEILSFTGNTMITSVFINAGYDRSVVYFMDKIIHEAAHTYLFLINLQEEMVLNSREKSYLSPLRGDKRDMIGIYHSTFVIQRLIYSFVSVLNHYKNLSETLYEEIASLIHLYYGKIDEAYDIVKKFGEISYIANNLLDEGQDIILSMKASL